VRSSLLTYIGFVVVTLLALFIVQSLNIAYPVTITTKTAPQDLAVVGVGKVTVVPNTATVTVGIVVSNAKTVDETQEEINVINNKIIESMGKLGIAKMDIKTSNYSINPDYSYTNGTNQITGYSGNASLTVTVKDTKVLPQVITEATKAGANQVGDPQYTVDSPEKFREEARNKAIANAKEEAAKLAQSLGIKLGKVTNIVESQPNNPVPMFYQADALKTANSAEITPPTIEAGSQEITSTITLYFEKK
jgi:uncharacterized protein YggE